MGRTLLLVLLLSSLAVVRSADGPFPIISKPDVAPKSLHIDYIQEVGSCAYEVNITTSCSSPLFRTDDTGILFGDSHGNQIIERKLDKEGKAFGSCNTDSFDLKDRPCIDQISYMYIYKDGAENWLPTSVEISGSDIKSLLFIFNSKIPKDTWFGFDLRQSISPAPSDYPFPPFLPGDSPPPPSHFPPPEPISPPPPEPILPPPPPPPSSSSKVSSQKWAMAFGILGLLMTIALP